MSSTDLRYLFSGLHTAGIECLSAALNTPGDWAVFGRTDYVVRAVLQEAATGLSPSLKGVRADAKSLRRCRGGQPKFFTHGPSVLEGDVECPVQLVAVGL